MRGQLHRLVDRAVGDCRLGDADPGKPRRELGAPARAVHRCTHRGDETTASPRVVEPNCVHPTARTRGVSAHTAAVSSAVATVLPADVIATRMSLSAVAGDRQGATGKPPCPAWQIAPLVPDRVQHIGTRGSQTSPHGAVRSAISKIVPVMPAAPVVPRNATAHAVSHHQLPATVPSGGW